MNRIRVEASRSYDILVGRGLLQRCGELAAEVCAPGSVMLVSDSNVYPLFGGAVERSLEGAGFRVQSFVFPAGEGSKNLSTYGQLLEEMARTRLTRSDLLVALGGGVVGDLGGFAAATYLRGIPYIQLPTTLLAAVDSSVGGKTAVDLQSGKNLAGCFYQPSLVVCDADALATLPEMVFRDGCAEVIKYGMLGNPELFRRLEQEDARDWTEEIISVCAGMKRDIVAEDEFDKGRRMLLNLGHSFGHAVELCSGYSVPHGSAVAIGMAMITRAAAAKGCCSPLLPGRLSALLEANGLPTRCGYGAEQLFEAAMQDKKLTGSRMHLVVPGEIGRCEIMEMPAGEMMDWLRAGGAE